MINKYLFFILLLFTPHILSSQVKENVLAKASVIDEHTIKLRWSPAGTRAWVEGKKYGFTVERYTMMINDVWQDKPQKKSIGAFLAQAEKNWEEQALKSDYAAVIAQAFYGEDFELSSSSTNDIASIINQAEELEQRFSTSVFMAEYDYKAAELAGWAYTDEEAKENERYLYRIYLNRPNKQAGDTATVYIGFADKKELPEPIGLNAIFGDKSAMLTWNYTLLSNIYHSYHIEKQVGNGKFIRITDLPVTALNAEMQEIFHIDSLKDNETTYSYRVTGITSFQEESPFSEVVTGKGVKSVSCVPAIYSGDFVAQNKAKIYWEFDCKEIELAGKFQITKSNSPQGEFSLLTGDVSLDKRELELNLSDETNYVKVKVINKDNSSQESFPFLLRQIDSIPPAIPQELSVRIDSLGVAHLSWNANNEPDLRGYRILRSFTKDGEKSSLLPQLITDTTYSDTLSLVLGNDKVYYSLSSADMRYNESEPCEDVIAVKPGKKTPASPVFTGYEVNNGRVKLSWISDSKYPDLKYSLVRTLQKGDKYNSETVFSGNYTTNEFMDAPDESGDYRYVVLVQDSSVIVAKSPKELFVSLVVPQQNKVANFSSYIDRERNYIELSWTKHPKATMYRLYKAEEGKPMSLWKELEASQNRIVDEHIFAGAKYSYTILFITEKDGPSQAKTITLDF